MATTMQCDIASTESRIFSGRVELLVCTGTLGDMGIRELVQIHHRQGLGRKCNKQYRRVGGILYLEFEERSGKRRLEEHGMGSFENYFLRTYLRHRKAGQA